MKANFVFAVSLWSLRHRPHRVRVSLPTRLRTAVLCVLVLGTRPSEWGIFRWQCLLRHREYSTLGTRCLAQSDDTIGDVGDAVHWNWSSDCRIRTERRVRLSGKSSDDRDTCFFLRCPSSI